MQKIRGFVYFEGKNIGDVKSAFKDFTFDDTELAFFSSLLRYGHEISSPGVFITGNVGDSHSSEDIINSLRKQMDLKEELKGCDVSIESEDTLKSLTHGALKGNYIGIRIRPPYGLDKIYNLTSNIGKLINAHDIFVRTVELEEVKPIVCIDLITEAGFEEKRKDVEDILSSEGLILGKYTRFSFL